VANRATTGSELGLDVGPAGKNTAKAAALLSGSRSQIDSEWKILCHASCANGAGQQRVSLAQQALLKHAVAGRTQRVDLLPRTCYTG